MGQLIEHGPHELAGVSARAFEIVMQLERDRFLSPSRYECNAGLRGYANGHKPKRVHTIAGTIAVQLQKTAAHGDEPFFTKSLERWCISVRAVMLSEGSTLKRIRKTLIISEVSKLGCNLCNEVVVMLLFTITAYFAYTACNVMLPEVLVIGVVFLQIGISAKIQKAVQLSMKFELYFALIVDRIALAKAYQEPTPGIRELMLKHRSRFEGLSFAHSDKAINFSLNFEIPVRQILVLRGPLGTAKTTLIDPLISLNRLASLVSIAGVLRAEIYLVRWRRKIGYVPQELSLVLADVRENIGIGDAPISDAMIVDVLRQTQSHDFVTSMPAGFLPSLGEMDGTMSGVQRKRISLARALLTAPKQDLVANISALKNCYVILIVTYCQASTVIADRLYYLGGDGVGLVDEEGRLALA